MALYKELEQVLHIMAKTGDKVIVVSESHAPYVLMSIGEYEAFLKGGSSVKDMTEQQLLDKINRDIAVWKASQEDLSDYDLDDFRVKSLRKEENKQPILLPSSENPVNVDKHEVEEEDKYYIEPVE